MTLRTIALLASCAGALCAAGDLRTPAVAENHQPSYFWKVNDVGNTAQLLALFCRGCVGNSSASLDVPLVAVLRDTLGDSDPQNDRVTDVWLLTYAHPSLGQRLLAAVPFFYWHVGGGVEKPGSNPAPLLDLEAPQHPMLQQAGRDLVQWTLFDPMTTPVRASTRAYGSNEIEYERLHLEEAIDYLRQAPVSNDSSALTRDELNTTIARLELRKRLLGGLVAQGRTADIGRQEEIEEQEIRSRNWELLRQCADRTGLLFEPLSLAGSKDQYAILWFPLHTQPDLPATSLTNAWRVLNLKNPWTDEHFKNWRGPVFRRVLDANGGLAPEGTSGKPVELVPLAVYSLNYPGSPLLLVDFRGKLRVRRHEMTQRTINEITAGVIGISHFTNWYYFVAADFYDFVSRHRGRAVDQAERLDCYSEFRVQLALDRDLDPVLRRSMERHVRELAINPLDAPPAQELAAAARRYERLVYASDDNGALIARLDKQRRAELAAFGESDAARVRDMLLHAASFGLYTRAARRNPTNLAMLDMDRRAAYELNFLDSLVRAGTEPEVACEPSRIERSVAELQRLMPFVESKRLRKHALDTLAKLDSLSKNGAIQSTTVLAMTSIERDSRTYNGSVPGVAAIVESAK